MINEVQKTPVNKWGKLFSILAAVVAFLIVLALSLAVHVPSASASITTEEDISGIQPPITRLASDDASGTALDIAAQTYSGGKTTDWVIIARDDDFADAMSATGLAGSLNAPILLVNRANGLSDAVKAQIKSLGAKHAYIIGGTGAIPADVESQLISMGVNTESGSPSRAETRIYGQSYYDTSVECAKKIAQHSTLGSSDVIVAMGINFQDALSISSLAYKYNLPIFLQTEGATSQERSLTDEAVSAVKAIVGDENNQKGTIYVPGGTGALTKASVEGVFGESLCQRIYGQDGFETSNEIARYFTSSAGGNKLSTSTVCIANGVEKPKGTDALAGAALAGQNGGVILLANTNEVFGETSTITLEGTYQKDGKAVHGFLADNKKVIDEVFVLGGTSVMPKTVIDICKTHLWNWCKVTFNTAGGSQVDSQKVWSGEYATKVSDPTKANLEFGGWYKNDSFTSPFNFETNAITKTTTIYAKWQKSATTDSQGQATIENPKTGEEQKVAVTTKDGTPIPGAEVTVDQNGTTEVTLPKGYENEDVVVKVTDPDGNPEEGKNVVVKNPDDTVRDSGKTDKNGEFSAGANTGKTDENGSTTPYNPVTGKQEITTLVTDGEGNPIEGAKVEIDPSTGASVVTLPDDTSSKDIVIKITDLDGNPVSKDVVIKNSDGSTRDSGKTSPVDGTFTSPASGSGGTTGSDGTTTDTKDPTTGEVLKVAVTTSDGEPVKDAEIIVDQNGTATVKLPDGYDNKDIVVKITDADGNPKNNKGVVVKNPDDSVRASGNTDSRGIFNAPASGGITNPTGNIKVLNPKDGKYYDFTVQNVDDNNYGVEGAKVSINSDGVASVVLPSSADGAVIEVFVKEHETQSPVAGFQVGLAESTGKVRGSGQTKSPDGSVLFGFITESAVSITNPNNLVYSGKAQTPAVSVSGLTEGSDFALTYSNNINATTETSKASVTVTGQGTYIGSVTKTFEIAKANTTLQLEGNMYAASYETLADVKMPSAVVYGVDNTPLVSGTLSWVDANTTSVGDGTVSGATHSFALQYTLSGINAQNYNNPASVFKDITVFTDAGYWLANAAQASGANANEDACKKLPSYKNASKIKANVASLHDAYATDYTNVLEEYEAYMSKNDASKEVHLFTTYSDVDMVDANNFAEFRIIQVGAHQNSADKTSTDGSVLTFHSTHLFPRAYAMKTTSAVNNGGWASSDMYTYLQAGGTFCSNFEASFVNAIKQTPKTYNTAGGNGNLVTRTTTGDKFFLLSYGEITGAAQSYTPSLNSEGLQYDYFAAKSISTTNVNSVLAYKTRAGEYPTGAESSFSKWWLRSPRTTSSQEFMRIGTDGIVDYSDLANAAYGVAPAFCF